MNISDRFIPVRGGQSEIELQDLLMDISLDESGMKNNHEAMMTQQP
jgi:hypothetical protein